MFAGQRSACGCQEREEQPAGRGAAEVLPGSRGTQTRGGDAAGTSHAIIRFIDAVLKKANQYIRFPKERKHQLPAAHNSSAVMHFSIKPRSRACLRKMRSGSRQDLPLPQRPGQGQGHGHRSATQQSPCSPARVEIKAGNYLNISYQHHRGVWRGSPAPSRTNPAGSNRAPEGPPSILMPLHHCMDLQPPGPKRGHSAMHQNWRETGKHQTSGCTWQKLDLSTWNPGKPNNGAQHAVLPAALIHSLNH